MSNIPKPLDLDMIYNSEQYLRSNHTKIGLENLNKISNSPELPDEILEEVLVRSSVKHLMQYKCVSKPWNRSINSPQFAKTHLQHLINNKTRGPIRPIWVPKHTANDGFYLPEGHRIRVRGGAEGIMEPSHLELRMAFSRGRNEVQNSVHGMLLIVSHSNIILWNPSIKVYRELPIPDSFYGTWECIGLGYDDSEGQKDYKVVRFQTDMTTNNGIEGFFITRSSSLVPTYYLSLIRGTLLPYPEIFSVKTNTWRQLSNEYFPYFAYSTQQPAHINGHIYWLTIKCQLQVQAQEHGVILAFDLRNEKFREVASPPLMTAANFYKKSLGVLEGCLCLVGHDLSEQGNANIWVQKEADVRSSWTLIYTISDQNWTKFFRVVSESYSSNWEILVCSESNELIVCNLQSNNTRVLRVPRRWLDSNLLTYEETLVSPTGLICLN